MQTIQKLETRLPRPETIEQAIEMDSRLEYWPVNKQVHANIKNDPGMQSHVFMDMLLDREILKQLRRYSISTGESPQIIVYRDDDGPVPIKAVSSLFYQIPLEKVWEKAVDRLGEPVEEKATNQAIIAHFEAQTTHYKENGMEVPEEYEIRPTVAFSFNFAERAFQLGFVIGVMTCENQIFTFFGDSKVVHNRFKIEHRGFSIEGALDKLMNNLTKLDEIIAKAKETPLPLYATPAIYWKGAHGQQKTIEKVYEAHAKMVVKKGGSQEITLWDAVMNLTYVSTHQTPNINSAVQLSTRAGATLINMGSLVNDDYVRALGYFMHGKRTTLGQTWQKEAPFFQRVPLDDLMYHVAEILTDELHERIEADKAVLAEVKSTPVQNMHRHRNGTEEE